MDYEKRMLEFWETNNIFNKSECREGEPFIFYDGPPFATGLPHYGHLLTSAIKDAILRYRVMHGNKVRRRWGWDCHGLPIENIVEAELSLNTKKDIEEYGIEEFNKRARASVLHYIAQWKEIIPRFGRFVDMEHDYRTMDSAYTESIWWAFKTLYNKGLMYEGYKAMHICPRCETTLANFEVNQGYKDVTDISVTIKFPVVGEENTFFLAWTTTPWTLPGNVALAVSPELLYVRVKVGEENYILAKDRAPHVLTGEYTIINELKGKDLAGKAYTPLFDYFNADAALKNRERGWKLYMADFVTGEDGTGIVHIAPAFGEDDMELGAHEELPFIQHGGMDGRFSSTVRDFAGEPVKSKDNPMATDVLILKHLAGKNLLFAKEKVVHSYPHCWRCDTPLLNYAARSWFMNVTVMRDELIKANQAVTWIPAHIRDGRFGKWLEGVRDWAISRSRFWGAPLPVWRCDACKELKIVGSLAELGGVQIAKNNYFLMRHGEIEGNKNDQVSSDVRAKTPLTPDGAASVLLSARELAGERIDFIISSPFDRTQESARIVARELGLKPDALIIDPRLGEINTGNFTGGTWQQYWSRYSSSEARWTEHPYGGENKTDMQKRIEEFLKDSESRYRDKRILIISHGLPLVMLRTLFEGVGAHLRTGEWHNAGGPELHRPAIDAITFPCSCGGEMRRIPDVFDCWFESGSMPYAQFHYPFENKKEFKKNFPADFIGEGLDQTRGWFYNMLVLSMGLFGKTPFKNVIVNGLILAEDGQKMSKRLKNYPDPQEVVSKYGADALRYYMLSSPIMRGEDLKFSEKGVDEVQKKVIGRLLNVLSFYELYADPSVKATGTSKNILDRWIFAPLSETTLAIEHSLDRYKLDSATRPIGEFVDDLCTLYLRRSRDRFKGADLRGIDADQRRSDRKAALGTMRFVLLEFSKTIAPTLPFIAEEMYQKVKEKKNEESVHLESWPETNKQRTTNNKQLILNMAEAKRVASLGLEARAKAGIKVRQPIATLKIKNQKSKIKNNKELLQLIKDELNVKAILFDAHGTSEVEIDTIITPELKKEGQFRELVRNIQDLRKKEGFTTKDHAVLEVQTGSEGEDLIKLFVDNIRQVCLLKDITFVQTVMGEGIKIDDLVFVVRLRK